MRQTPFLRTLVLLDVLVVMAGLPMQAHSEQQQHLEERERQLLEQWRVSAKAFEDQHPQTDFNDILTAKQFDERLAEDRERAARGARAAAQVAIEMTNAQTAEFNAIKPKAEAGDPEAQLLLSWMYDNGYGTKRDYAEAFKWWLKAADQGVAVAQFNVAVMYFAGQGVDRNYTEAVAWYRKAADQRWGDAYANLGWMYNSGQGVTKDAIEAKLLWRQGADLGSFKAKLALNPAGPKVIMGSTPGRLLFLADDGVCCGQEIVNPQQHTAYLSQMTQGDAEHRRREQEGTPAFEGISMALGEGTQASENVKTVSEIVADYHAKHTYLGKQSGASENIFVCGDMANDVWNMVFTKGMQAKILVGNVDRKIKSMIEADHAWVMAEVSPGKWLALEATGGHAVPINENAKYYNGHSFSNPNEFKEYTTLVREYKTALSKHRSAAENYNEMVNQYNGADGFTQQRLGYEMAQRQAILTERIADLNQVTGKLKGLLSEKD